MVPMVMTVIMFVGHSPHAAVRLCFTRAECALPCNSCAFGRLNTVCRVDTSVVLTLRQRACSNAAVIDEKCGDGSAQEASTDMSCQGRRADGARAVQLHSIAFVTARTSLLSTVECFVAEFADTGHVAPMWQQERCASPERKRCVVSLSVLCNHAYRRVHRLPPISQ